jgi:hypothetical protein
MTYLGETGGLYGSVGTKAEEAENVYILQAALRPAQWEPKPPFLMSN